jgi:phosphoribosyl-ATP pyrophosphohydrolase/phosphoribosyl-AMP cyclohydrolase
MNNLQWLDEVKFNEQGLVPAIAQHHQTGRVLMVAWMNREALALTAEKPSRMFLSFTQQIMAQRRRIWAFSNRA